MACSARSATVSAHRPRDPTGTALYTLIAEQRATFTSVASEAGGNLVLYAGVLAPNAKLRSEVVGYARPAASRLLPVVAVAHRLCFASAERPRSLLVLNEARGIRVLHPTRTEMGMAITFRLR